jgi:uncharacterized membrane protein YcgQ (UPF0703/DUF1980 family)
MLKNARKNTIHMVAAIMACLIILSGCANGASAQTWTNGNGTSAVNLSHEVLAERTNGEFIEIREKMFVAQTNDIYLNAQEYLGRVIKYEGLFVEFQNTNTDATYYSVIRYGPGCCGIDNNVGFEIVWDGEYPEAHEWVEVTGVLEEYEEGGSWFLQLKVDSLNVLAKRGAETVTQ